MTELQLYTLLQSILVENLETLGYDSSVVDVQHAYQPTIEGTSSLPSIIFYPIADHRYGWPKRSSEWDADAEVMTDVNKQIMEATFQITARGEYDKTNPAALTAADWVNLAAGILQSDVAISTFVAQNMGVQRITDVRKPYLTDQHDQNILAPSFDVTLVHTSELRLPGRKIYDTTPGIYRV
jgi:hypothetical protein